MMMWEVEEDIECLLLRLKASGDRAWLEQSLNVPGRWWRKHGTRIERARGDSNDDRPRQASSHAGRNASTDRRGDTDPRPVVSEERVGMSVSSIVTTVFIGARLTSRCHLYGLY